ncbi:hypothetical protein [Spirillospora sp. CA-294931]|uniref:hypothetical protein n=1 Tax=Spirillospora sp. CA-294931 TaxID=3240042 RepID=UPI003D938B9C
MSGRQNGWWISPAIPTIANCLLALLWGFSAYGGWGDAAFCGEAEARDPVCSSDFELAVLFSVPPAVLAAAIAVAAWALPSTRHRPDRLDALLTIAAIVWILAEGILFIGGYVAKQ